MFATMNPNGDYLSDALAAQAGGIGFAPGENINFEPGRRFLMPRMALLPGILIRIGPIRVR